MIDRLAEVSCCLEQSGELRASEDATTAQLRSPRRSSCLPIPRGAHASGMSILYAARMGRRLLAARPRYSSHITQSVAMPALAPAPERKGGALQPSAPAGTALLQRRRLLVAGPQGLHAVLLASTGGDGAMR